ncbi:hypothetical protein Bca52824_026194 [Brassica carinata]|uniref:C2H2-type domain-containing protein n=1 Tax=Brassica carinata TaxID=52824 RepID=A0A8X7SHA4_BRACI|nr:hypothetical protein Bca52824_026194 [Brassica carinata]
MMISHHSLHQPRCMICFKHCKSFESTARLFSLNEGCTLCLQIFEDATALADHKNKCHLSLCTYSSCKFFFFPLWIRLTTLINVNPTRTLGVNTRLKAVAIDCEMVGGGDDGSIDICASICLVDEDEHVIFSTHVQPQPPCHRLQVTGLTEEDLKNGMRLQDVQEKVLAILCDGHNDGAGRLLLVGHDLRHDLKCLELQYPIHLLRLDTAKYVPLMKTSLVSHSLKYHTMSYLGYRIQCGNHEPYTRECGIKSMERQKKKGKQGMDCTRGNRAI